MKIGRTAGFLCAVLLLCLFPLAAHAEYCERDDLSLGHLHYEPGILVKTDKASASAPDAETVIRALARADEATEAGARTNGLPSPVRETPVTWEFTLISDLLPMQTEDGLFSRFTDPKDPVYLTYSCHKEESEAALIPFETEYRENDENYDGVRTAISPGKNGLAEILWDVSIDPMTGKERGRTEVSRKTVQNPVSEVAYLGDFPLTDPSVSTGTYVWPLPDNDRFLNREGYEPGTVPIGMTIYLSSGYGGRNLWGTYDFHLGYDIAAPVNTEIYACDGGVVVWAHYSDSYGYAVRILHANGTETLYAHMRRYVVHDGDIVKQGQLLGYVGSTGSSSACHLHLEFRRDHVTCDPGEFITIPENVADRRDLNK